MPKLSLAEYRDSLQNFLVTRYRVVNEKVKRFGELKGMKAMKIPALADTLTRGMSNVSTLTESSTRLSQTVSEKVGRSPINRFWQKTGLLRYYLVAAVLFVPTFAGIYKSMNIEEIAKSIAYARDRKSEPRG